MPVQPLDYGPLTSKPFATLGEIAAQRDQRETSKLNREIARSNLDIRQRELADKEKSAQEAADEQQAVAAAFQANTGPDGPNQKAILETLYHSGRPQSAEKVRAAFAKALKEAGEAHKLE